MEEVETQPQEDVMENVQEIAEQVEQQDVDQPEVEAEEQEPQQVPLTALQKERRKRQELEERAYRAEVEAQYLREQAQARNQPEPEESEDDYEPTTRRDLEKTRQLTKQEVVRDVEERLWKKQNPEKADYVSANLEAFLNKRPNLASAIADSVNRYEEAYTLMSALSPREQKALKPAPAKKSAPNAPTSVPKAAGINQTMNVMDMSDEEFNEWRRGKKQRR